MQSSSASASSLPELFEAAPDWLKWLGLGTAAGLLSMAIFAWLLTKSFRLLKGTFTDHELGRTGNVVHVLGQAVLNVLVLQHFRSSKTLNLFDSVRIRIEHEIFRAKDRPLSTDHPFSDLTIGHLDTPDERTRKLNAGDVNAAMDRIKTYFIVLRDLETDPKEIKFLTTLTIETGFVSPLLLLAGLLSRFDKAWPMIVRAYNEDVGDELKHTWVERIRGKKNAAPLWTTMFRKYQKFNFDCWLQWGPSIPNSKSHYDKEFTSIQYGFGDENNSIELVADRRFLKDQLKPLWEGEEWRSLARPARVQGKIVHSTVLSIDDKKDAGSALKDAWGTEGRILLQRVDDKAWMVKHSDRGQYYSAYLWVMFVVMVRRAEDQPLTPLHPSSANPDLTSHPWLDLFPFFEHCNIACPAALMLIKEQLALKAVSGIARLVKHAAPDPFPLRFVFTCAIDEPGDGSTMWLDMLDEPRTGEKSILMSIRELAPQFEQLFSGDDPIIRLDHYEGASVSDRPYSTHGLIRHVNAVYEHIEQVTEGRRASGPTSSVF
jgi:hypothetical protein